MDTQNTTPQPQSTPVQTSSKSYIIVIIALLALVLGGLGGYFLGTKSSPKQITDTSVQPTQSPNIQNTNQFSNITYLMKYRDGGPNKEKAIFVTRSSSEESLKLSDINMSEASTKTLHKFDSPSAVGFNPPFNIVNDYIIAPVAGADANDILIFRLNGDVISTGVRQGNTELSNWIVSYDEWVKDNIIKVRLFQIDNSTATAQIDLTTGKIVPGSYTKLGKLQQ